ncbi:hypothetical protein BRC83_10085 [Halobacteriales archaeon QS_1_68_17]|nr:MAG: hypothetical protein BRC83_10085 [Halobacteriales archaeon QS_1_68_17]
MDSLDSILSHGEQAVAAGLRDGRSVEAIARERDVDPETVEKAVDRIHQKTDRAVATLLQSPFVEDAVDDLNPDERARLRAAVADDE